MLLPFGAVMIGTWPLNGATAVGRTASARTRVEARGRATSGRARAVQIDVLMSSIRERNQNWIGVSVKPGWKVHCPGFQSQRSIGTQVRAHVDRDTHLARYRRRLRKSRQRNAGHSKS